VGAGRLVLRGGGPRAVVATTAELRVLRLLPTHLSFREIAGNLHVSANTIKTQAHAVYRKLNASSRTEAVASARQVGLLDPC
jgi:LuxR family maltose regulon positive regulatory protein